ncbi:MAG: DUF4373 domain-containing protein [Butyricicoccus sp.]
MGRNRKVGLDWWPRDIGLYRDPKLRAARQKFGVLGPYVYECLLDIAYGDKGYYIAYSGEGREDTLWQLREYTAGLENVTIETLAAVVDQLAASGLFHAALYERGFLTSKRIQMGYFLTVSCPVPSIDIWLHRAGNAGEESEWQVFCAACIYFPHGKCDLSYGKCDLLYRKSTEQRRAENRRAEDSRGQ